LIVFRPSSWPTSERATDARVTPARVLGGELNDQALQRGGRAGAGALSFSGAVVLLGDELAVPAQDGVGRHQSGELFQRTSADEAALRGEPPALGVGAAQAPTAELLPQDAVLLLEVRDDLGLGRFIQPANTRSKNCSGATDIFGDLTRAEPGAAGLHPTTASRKA
jgi:hypothetical protein